VPGERFSTKRPDTQIGHGVPIARGTGKVSEHGGFAFDDRTVILIVSNPAFSPSIYTGTVETRPVAPTVLSALGLNPWVFSQFACGLAVSTAP